MTLIWTVASRHCVVHSSDRLVTWSGGGGEADPAANKNVVYHGRDCVATIGFTGLAHLDGLPTDSWIARSILGTDVEGMYIGRISTTRPLRLRELVARLSSGMTTAFSGRHRSHRRFHHEVLIGGWKLTPGGRAWPFSLSVAKPSDSGTVRVRHHLSRRLWSRGEYVITAAGTAPFTPQEIEDLRLAVSASLRSPKQVAELLAMATRAAAQRSSVVGPHCMTSIIPAPRGRFDVSVRLISDPASLQPPLYYMPWIIMGESLAVRPSAMWTREITDQPGLTFSEGFATVTTYR